MRTVRRAFTLAELIVVIAVIALLVGLLLPAVCKVRHAAAHARCANNLKQLALAAHTYRDQHDAFPPGTMPGTTLPPDQRLGLFIVLLPYTEAQQVYARLAPAEPWDAPANAAAVAGYAPLLYHCPDWPGPQPSASAGPPAHTNYVGVAGLGADAATLPDTDPRIGVLGYDRRLKPGQVKDGLANTLLLLETGRDVGPWVRGGPATVRGVDPSDAPPVGAGRPFGGTHVSDGRFRTKGPHGGHAALADGSVRKLSDGMDAAVLGKLATAAGGEDVPAEW